MKDLKAPYLGVAYYPEDWPECEIDKDIEKMHEIGIKLVRIGEFAWHRMEPKPGEFDFSFFHRVVDKMGEAGIGVVMGTPTATPPRWFGKAHPEAYTELPNGSKSVHGARRSFCSNNEDYNRYSMRIVKKMAQEFADDPYIVGWQIDNEIYAWEDGCFCPDCQKAFHEYLKNIYGTIEKLNEAWNLNLFSQWYDDFDEIPAPRNAWHNPHLIMHWRIFQNESHIAYVHKQAEILHRYVKVPVGTDTMPFNGMDYRHMTDKLDVVQFNHYNVPENIHAECFWFDYLRNFKNRPFWNTETATCWNGSVAIGQSIKPDGFCRANSWLPIILGGEANLYWLWRTHWAGHELMHGAVLDTSGNDMVSTDEVREVAKGFEKAADLINETKVAPDLALHYTSLGWNMHGTQPVVDGWNYQDTVQKFYQPMTALGLRPDVVDAAEDLSRFKLVFTPALMTLEEADLGKRMADWVREGGTWVVGPLTDVRNIDGARYQDRYFGILEELTGMKWRFFAPDREGRIKAEWSDGSAFEGNTWFEMCDADEDALVKVTEGHKAILGKALALKKKVGKGSVIFVGSIPSEEDLTKIIRLAAEESGVKLPEVDGKIMVSRREGNGKKGLMLAEYGCAPASFTLEKPMLDLLTGETLSGKIAFEPYGVKILENID